MAGTPAFRRLPAAERREEIVAAATGVIATSGYNGASLDAFAQAAGMTKAGLLHHFSGKEELLVAVLERREATAVLVDVQQAFEDAAAARTAVTAIVARSLTQPQLVQLYTRLSAEALDPAHPAHRYFQRRLHEARGHLMRTVFAWHPTPKLAADQMMAFLDGLYLFWLRDPEFDAMAHWRAFATQLFGAGTG